MSGFKSEKKKFALWDMKISQFIFFSISVVKTRFCVSITISKFDKFFAFEISDNLEPILILSSILSRRPWVKGLSDLFSILSPFPASQVTSECGKTFLRVLKKGILSKASPNKSSPT